MIKGIKLWLQATRPKTLSAGIAPVLMGSVLVWDTPYFHWALFASILGCTLFIQVGTNFANDYFDNQKGADTEDRLGPQRMTQSGLISPAKMKLAFILCFIFASVLSIKLVLIGGLSIAFIGALSILFGILYTGGPYPLGYNGLGDIFVLVFFGPVAVAGTYYLYTLQFVTEVMIIGLIPGLLATAILVVNNLRDIPTDSQTGKNTLAVRFGETFCVWEYATCLFAALGLTIWIIFNHPDQIELIGPAFILTILSPKLIKAVRLKRGKELNPILEKTGKLLLIYSLLFCIAWIA
ncbi:1,4-dihydroxy-2-naphthoate polyprenyltransferase [bacterium]|jgi:1,4-dihydroxy-2-naphthoate polyprenyltransferase|nr:1,4-dihydroxy-2-naphthoate polyprenyltransferase [bacterium]